MNKTDQLTIHNITQSLLDQLTIPAKISLSDQDEEILITIDTEEAGPLIGYHGKSLTAMQTLIAQMAYHDLGRWVRINVTVGDYRQRREEQLKQMALSTAEKVMQTGQEVVLPDLSAADRRIIHLTLGEHPQVKSESVGEGRYRQLVIKPKPTA